MLEKSSRTPKTAESTEPRDMALSKKTDESEVVSAGTLEEVIQRVKYLRSLPVGPATHYPQARDDEAIVAEHVLGEFVVYDLHRHQVHSLNPTATMVWQWCDGKTSVDLLAQRLSTCLNLPLENAKPLLYLSFDRLEKAKLLMQKVERPLMHQSVSRRDVLQRLGAATLLPVVYTMVAPAAADAQSASCGSSVSGCNPCSSTGACCDCSVAVQCVSTNPGDVACCGSIFDDCRCLPPSDCSTLGGTACETACT